MRLALILACCLPLFCAAQTDTSSSKTTGFRTEKRTDLALGYNFYFGKKEEDDTSSRQYHLLEIGLWRSRFYFHRHWGGFACHAASEVGLGTQKLLVAPKIGGFLAVGPLILGNDFALYTDFSESSLRWIPYFGIGANRFKLTINPHVVLSNKDFLANRFPAGQMHFSFALINIHRKRIDFAGANAH
jgi:hypothetical protein